MSLGGPRAFAIYKFSAASNMSPAKVLEIRQLATALSNDLEICRL